MDLYAEHHYCEHYQHDDQRDDDAHLTVVCNTVSHSLNTTTIYGAHDQL
jgi:hypothetical protein